jgi:hypothetical protein
MTNDFSTRKRFLTSIWGYLLTILIIFAVNLPSPVAAQTFIVHLLNGKSGKPIPNRKVIVRWFSGLNSSEVSMDQNGAGFLTVPEGAQQFIIMVGPKQGNEPYRLDYIDCNEPAMSSIQVKQVVEAGFVPIDKCGHRKAIARPGEIIFWAKLKPWWMPDLQ